MSSGIEIDLGGVPDRLNDVSDGVRDLSPLMSDFEDILLSGVEEAFRLEEGPDGPWARLAESTIEDRKRENKWPGDILQRSAGGLAASVQGESDATSASVFTNKRYGPIHQFGGTSDMPPGPANVPARPFLSISDATQRELDDATDDYLDGLLD